MSSKRTSAKPETIRLISFLRENKSKYAKLTLRTGLTLSYVKIHAIHERQAEIGWITDAELESNQLMPDINRSVRQQATNFIVQQNKKNQKVFVKPSFNQRP